MTPGAEKRKKSCRSQTQTQTQSAQQQQIHGRNRKKRGDYNISMENDIHGIHMLQILGAADVPKIKNSASPTPLNPSPTILQAD